MDWKKLLPLNLLAFALMPSVLAQEETLVSYLVSGVVKIARWVLEFFLGEEAFMESNILVIKLGLCIMAFAVMFYALTRANIIDHRPAAGIIAAVIALIGVKFMPNPWVVALATLFRFIVLWIVIILIVPYLLVTRIIRTPGWFRRIILIAAYIAIFFGITQLSYLEVGDDILGTIFGYLAAYSLLAKIIAGIAIIVIAAWILNRSRRITTEEYQQRSEDRRAREKMGHERRMAK